MTAPTGAHVVLEAALASGADVCFANPGTTEMHLVNALDDLSGIRPVLGLFEGVVTGAADGFARMAGRPALTLLHLGPGLANGIANLHNARRAHSPVVNLVGDHASWHLAADAPLTSDIEAMASAVGAVRVSTTVDDLSADVVETFAASAGPPAGPSTLVLPQDLTWTEAAHEPTDSLAAQAARVPRATSPPPSPSPAPPPDLVTSAADGLRGGTSTALIVGGDGLTDAGIRAASRIAATTGCHLWAETFSGRIERGGGLPSIPPLPYFPEAAIGALVGLDFVVLAGTGDPVAFFGYPDTPSRLLPDGCERMTLSAPGHPTAEALSAVVEELGASPFDPVEIRSPERPYGELSTKTLGQALAASQPEHAIVVNEAATSGNPWVGMSAHAPAHDLLGLTGGAIGQGLPCAIGAAVACPDRPVVAFQADGSGLYTVQSLWTMARESLDVTVVVCANRAYRILQVEQHRTGAPMGDAGRRLMDLTEPPIDWVRVGTGLGVPSTSVSSAHSLAAELDRAFADEGPHLIEAQL